jgi:hypothetical protein
VNKTKNESFEPTANHLKNWNKFMKQTLQDDIFIPFDLDEYEDILTGVYQNCTFEQFLDETFVSVIFLNASISDKKQPHVIIKHPELNGVDFIANMNIPRKKHLSVNTYEPRFKQIKKEQVIRRFNKPSSTFASWKEDTKESLA